MSTPSGKIEIYTTLFCPFCIRAKQLLDAKGVMYYETDVTTRLSLREAMTERAGGRTSVLHGRGCAARQTCQISVAVSGPYM